MQTCADFREKRPLWKLAARFRGRLAVEAAELALACLPALWHEECEALREEEEVMSRR